jgi:hypothetical protein
LLTVRSGCCNKKISNRGWKLEVDFTVTVNIIIDYYRHFDDVPQFVLFVVARLGLT